MAQEEKTTTAQETTTRGRKAKAPEATVPSEPQTAHEASQELTTTGGAAKVPDDFSPDRKTTMLTFCEAMERAAEGKKLRRREWDNGVHASYHVTIRSGETLPMSGGENNMTPYAPSIGDALAKDWYEINEGENNA